MRRRQKRMRLRWMDQPSWILMNPPPPPPLVQFVLPQAMTDVTVAIAAKIMQEAKKNAREQKKRMKEVEEEDGDTILAMKKKLKLALHEKKAAKASRAKDTVRAKLVTASFDIISDLDDGLVKRAKPKLTRLDYWQLGNKAARERKSGYVSAATCGDTLGEVHMRLQTHSWAVMNNMTMLFPESCRPCLEQGDYILQTNEDNKVVLFEGAGTMAVVYPVSVTDALMLPLKGETHPMTYPRNNVMP
jgi:hypothetical protein